MNINIYSSKSFKLVTKHPRNVARKKRKHVK